MPQIDPSKVIGIRVYDKSMNVKALAKCNQRYGAIAKKKELLGAVVEIVGYRTTRNRFFCLWRLNIL